MIIICILFREPIGFGKQLVCQPAKVLMFDYYLLAQFMIKILFL